MIAITAVWSWAADSMPPEVAECEIVDITWEMGPELPVLRKGGTIGAVGDLLVAAGGMEHPWRESPATFGYRPGASRWEPLPDLPEGRVYTEGTVVAGRLYVIGGRFSGSTRKDVYCLRRSDTGWVWTPMPPLREDRGWFAVAAIGTRVFVAGGNRIAPGSPPFSPRSTLRTAELLDASNAGDGWRPLPDIPGRSRGWVAGAAAGGKFHIFGGAWYEMINGRPEARRLREALVLDPNENRWTTLPDMPYAISGLDAVTWRDRYIILVGGVADPAPATQQPGWYSNVVLVFDTGTGRYHRMPSLLPRATNDIRAAILADRIYAIGGENVEPATSNTTNCLRIGTIRYREGQRDRKPPGASRTGQAVVR